MESKANISDTAAKTGSDPRISRREFLGLIATLAGLACVGGVGAAFAGEGDLLRPPGGQDEESLLAACIKCDRCRSVCPTGVVAVSTVEDGLVCARTPKLNFHQGYCNFCGKCQVVCATGAIGAFDYTTQKIGVAIIQRDRCMAYIQECENCKNSCEYGALVFDSTGHPVIDAGSCNGCGKCEYDCTALVYGTFSGGTRRGVVVVSTDEYATIGTTLVEGEEE